jgi:putative ABC transport system permease protein
MKRLLRHQVVEIAVNAIRRNRLQTLLTMIGISMGVATVLAMMAVGAGAQRAVEQQVRAAGLNQLTIRAGNWRPKQEETGEAIAHQGDAHDSLSLPLPLGTSVPAGDLRPAQEPPSLLATSVPARGDGALWRGRRSRRGTEVTGRDGGLWVRRRSLAGTEVVALAAFHPEDDPMEKHDHPLARQRLGDLAAGLGSAATLTFEDADAIRDLPGVQYVACGVHENARVYAGDKRWFTRMHGTDLELPSIKRAWTFAHGRFFTAREQQRGDQVLVLGQVVADKLFGAGINPLGREVKLWSQPFNVVGVVTSATWVVRPAPGDDQFDAVYMPYTTTQRLLNLSKLNDITVTASSSGDVSRLAHAITALLRQRHGIGDNRPDDFTVITQASKALTTGGLPPTVARAVAGNVAELERVTLQQLAHTLEHAGRTMSWLLAGIAAVSLLVGGIGIMNISLLSVTERTREIGLRLAVGARSRDVMRQFLTEAVVLSVAGGTLGIVLGVVASIVISRALQWATVVSPVSIVLAFGVSALVGVFFGWYPATRAARLDPIEALRRE